MENDTVQNIDDVVESVNLVTRVSGKTNKPYTLCQIKLSNGLDIEFFPERAEVKILQLLINTPSK